MKMPNIDGARVLVIEDYELVLEIITDALEAMGAQVLQARDGKHGVAMAKKHLPDLVVSNYQMPEADGLEVLQALRSDRRTAKVPFIIMTAEASPSLQVRCTQLGADAFVDKADSIMDVFETVARVLRESEKRRILLPNGPGLPERL